MIIIHGDNIAESRKKLDAVLAQKENIKRLDGKSATVDSLTLLFDSTELFSVQKVVVIENCKAMHKKTVETLFSLSQNPDVEIVLWQNSTLDARFIKKFEDAQVFAFPLPKYYFSFLDNLAPRKATYVYATYKKLLDSFVPEQILFSMIKRVRHLLMMQTGQGNTFEEIAKMGSWQVQKLQSQARLWDSKQLKNFYQQLYALETNMKTSKLSTTLDKHIDILILSELQ